MNNGTSFSLNLFFWINVNVCKLQKNRTNGERKEKNRFELKRTLFLPHKMLQRV